MGLLLGAVVTYGLVLKRSSRIVLSFLLGHQPRCAVSLFDAIYQRINTCSSLWQLFGTLCDVYAYRPETRVIDQYYDVPTRVVAERDTFKGLTGFTFQFGYKSLSCRDGEL